MVRSLAFIALACLTACAGAARAAPTLIDDRQPVQVRLAVKRVEVSTPENLKKLYRRLEIAADRTCTTDDDADLAVPSLGDQCLAQAVSRTVRDLNIPELSRFDDRNPARRPQVLALADDQRPAQ